MSDRDKSDLVVIGGGVVGLSIAWEGARRGLNVVLLERDQVGRAASWAGAGIIPPPAGPGATHPLEVLGRRAWELHAQWAAELQRLSGLSTGYRQCGGLYLADRAGEAAALSAAAAAWTEEGWNFEKLTRPELETRFPELPAAAGFPSIRAALWAPEESQLRNPRHLQALAAASRIAGATLVEHAEVVGIEPDHAGWQVRVHQTTTGPRVWKTARVCVAGGAWTHRIVAPLKIAADIVPIRGQMALYRLDQVPFDYVLNVGPRYLVPRDDGHLLVGSTEEEAGFDLSTTREGLEGLREFALRWVPAVANCQPIKTWAGLRPNSVDGFPWIGPVPHEPGLFLASGHFRAGLTLSPATAEMLIDLMLEQTPLIDPAPFSPARGWNLKA